MLGTAWTSIPWPFNSPRLSLWLATLAADRPLTFLDHRLRTGDSLLGSSTADILRQPPPGGQAPGQSPCRCSIMTRSTRR